MAVLQSGPVQAEGRIRLEEVLPVRQIFGAEVHRLVAQQELHSFCVPCHDGVSQLHRSFVVDEVFDEFGVPGLGLGVLDERLCLAGEVDAAPGLDQLVDAESVVLLHGLPIARPQLPVGENQTN